MLRFLLLLLLNVAMTVFAQTEEVRLKILCTSDVHGNYFPRDFLTGGEGQGSLSRLATYVRGLRDEMEENHVILLDNGDILQGQPSAYYYNFIDTASTHVCADVLNHLKYDAATIGNHDIETGHPVYDRWTRQCHFPILCANAVKVTDGQPYWKPYVVLERAGIRVAVLGLTTPAVPQWLPENLWSGIRFEDMVATARRWMPVLQQQERADVVIGLLHSGAGAENAQGTMNEHAALQVAQSVPGFDIILCGHDHRPLCRMVKSKDEKLVAILNPGANAMSVAEADVRLRLKQGKTQNVDVLARIVNLNDFVPDSTYMSCFAAESEAISHFTEEVIGQCERTMGIREAFFGPSAFVDFIHTLQLKISGADVSLAAPLSMDAIIRKGPIRMADMFTLYKYENMLYVMRLTGRELKNYLEESYDGWIRTMRSEEDTLLNFRPHPERYGASWERLRNPGYNFDSAAGILYTVDVRRPKGQRIIITGMADGRPFHPDAVYRVAVNSYRGNGGGDLLTRGAGILHEELKDRIEWSTDKDLRYYLMQEIRKLGVLRPQPLNHWRFVPETWVEKAKKRDEMVLFGAE